MAKEERSVEPRDSPKPFIDEAIKYRQPFCANRATFSE
jgi:hypothetical protein